MSLLLTGAGASTIVSPLGVIYTNNGDSITGLLNTSGNFSSDGIKITAAKSGGTTFSSRLSYTINSYESNLETWQQTTTFNVLTKSGFGLAIGTDGTNPMCGLLFLNTIPGKIRIYNSSSGAVLAESAGSITINNNDVIIGIHSVVMNTHTFTFTNQNNSQSVSVSYTFPTIYPITQTQPVNFQPALYAVGGTQEITYWQYSSSALCNANYMFIGDSITARFFATNENQRWGILTFPLLTKNIYAGPGNKTSNFITTGLTNEITNLSPINAIICLGTNDVLTGVPVATSMANLTTLKNNLQAFGANVIFCQIPPLDSTSVVTYNSNLVSTFGGLVLVDFYTLLKGAGTQYAPGKSPDGIHPADTEQAGMANEVEISI